jgi:hypothetical protein
METLTMTKTLLLELPEEVEQQLLVQANQLNLSLPKFVLHSLTQWLTWTNAIAADPLRIERAANMTTHFKTVSQELLALPQRPAAPGGCGQETRGVGVQGTARRRARRGPPPG